MRGHPGAAARAKAYLPILLAMVILGVSSQLARWLKKESLAVAPITISAKPHVRQVIVSHGFVRIFVDVPVPQAPVAPPLATLAVPIHLHWVLGSPPLSPQTSDGAVKFAMNYTASVWNELASLALDIVLLRDNLTPANEQRLKAGIAKDNTRESSLGRYLPPLPSDDDLHIFLLGPALSQAISWSRRAYISAPVEQEAMAQALAQAVGKVLSLRTPSSTSCDKLCPTATSSSCNLMCPRFGLQPSLAQSQIERARSVARSLRRPSVGRVLGPGANAFKAPPAFFAKSLAVVFLAERVANASSVYKARFTLHCSEPEPFAFKSMVVLLEQRRPGSETRVLALGTVGRMNVKPGLERPGLSRLREIPQSDRERCPLRSFEVLVDPPARVAVGARLGISLSATEAQLGLVKTGRGGALVAQRPFSLDMVAATGSYALQVAPIDKVLLLNTWLQ